LRRATEDCTELIRQATEYEREWTKGRLNQAVGVAFAKDSGKVQFRSY